MTKPARSYARAGVLLALLLAAALLAWAWADGGLRPVHEIAETVPVPESAR